MTAGTILKAVETYLAALTAEVKGKTSVAETEVDAIESLGNKPEGFRVVLVWTGAKNPDSSSGRHGFVKGGLSAYVVAAKGLEARPGQSLHRSGTGGSLPFLDRLEWVIRMLRAVTFDHDQVDCQENLQLRGYEMLKYQESQGWRTARVDFEVGYVLDDPAGESGLDPLTLYGAITFSIVGAYLHITKNGVTRKVRLLDAD